MSGLLVHLPLQGGRLTEGLTGAPRRVLTLATALNTAGIEVKVCSEDGSEFMRQAESRALSTVDYQLPPTLITSGGTVFTGGWWYRVKLIFALIKQNINFSFTIRKTKAKAVWVRGSKGIALAAFATKLARRRLIWDVDYELPSQGVVRLLHLVGLKFADAVVFQYRSAPDDIFGKLTAEKYRQKFHSIIPGIELNRLEKKRRQSEAAAGSSSFSIIQVGTLCDRKNQLFSLRMLRQVLDCEPSKEVCLRFVGGVFDDDYMRVLNEEIETLGLQKHVDFLGWRDDVSELMSSADLLIMPSYDEGVPNTVQEAMYIGVPCIVSPVGGMAEVVQDEHTGWIRRIDDAGAWAEQISQCIEKSDKCREVTERAADFAANHFGTNSWVEQYAAVVDSVTRRKA